MTDEELSTSMKYTSWFPPTIAPARPGVYQRMGHLSGVVFAFWDGRGWRVAEYHNNHALYSNPRSMVQIQDHGYPWRGLKEPA